MVRVWPSALIARAFALPQAGSERNDRLLLLLLRLLLLLLSRPRFCHRRGEKCCARRAQMDASGAPTARQASGSRPRKGEGRLARWQYCPKRCQIKMRLRQSPPHSSSVRWPPRPGRLSYARKKEGREEGGREGQGDCLRHKKSAAEDRRVTSGRRRRTGGEREIYCLLGAGGALPGVRLGHPRPPACLCRTYHE